MKKYALAHGQEFFVNLLNIWVHTLNTMTTQDIWPFEQKINKNKIFMWTCLPLSELKCFDFYVIFVSLWII